MQYMGGKTRLSKHIVPILEAARLDGQVYLEPFVGSAAVLERMSGMRIGNDLLTPLIRMYRKLQEGWIPPTSLTKEEYNTYRYDTVWSEENDHLRAFVAIGCSFGGKWWGGYAANARQDNYALAAHRSLSKQAPMIKDAMFTNMGYVALNPKGMLIYCDPPYGGTTGYNGSPTFDTLEFWDVARKWAQNNTVFVSEYDAPAFAVEVWRKETTTQLNKNKTQKRLEKLYRIGN